MKWIDTLERKFGRFAIHGLIRIVVAFNALVFLLSLLDKHILAWLYLDPGLVMQGQVWRLVTYIFIPSTGDWWLMPNYLWLGFWLWFIWMIGDGLESAWGAFKLNLYYLIGMLGLTVSGFILGSTLSSGLINTSLIFAFATLNPDFPVFLFIFPVQIKWMARFYLFFLVLNFLAGSLALRMAIIATMSNYLIFFGPESWRAAGHRMSIAKRRQKFEMDSGRKDESMHCCVVCNRTEITNPDLDFRVSADGNEYCVEHLPPKNPTS